MNDIKQKIRKIRNRKKHGNYNYTNVPLLPTVYEDNELITYMPPLTKLNHPTPDLSLLYTPYNNGILNDNSLSKDLSKEGELTKKKEDLTTEKDSKKENIFQKTYRYFFPVKEGATSGPPPLDLTNLSFWQLPCDFINTKFYDNIIDTCLKAVDDYSDSDESKLKSDREIIQNTINQTLLIVIAFIMTINIYYFIFMYKWDCPHFAYLPGYGMFFGFSKDTNIAKSNNRLPGFILRDIRKPVLYCSYIYTVIYPYIFNFLGVRNYKRLCFIFIFLFMLCFVFITMKDIGFAAFSFVASGKINPLVMVIVLFSVFTGIFFTSQINEDAALTAAIHTPACDDSTVSAKVLQYYIEQQKKKRNGEEYYYCFQEDKDYPMSTQVEIVEHEHFPDEEPMEIGKELKEPDIAIPSVDPQVYSVLQAMGGKFALFVNGLLRIIIAMALLPIAQLAVTYFFLYTTSGLGLIINEGFSPLSKVMAHMNDNFGKHDDKVAPQEFYEVINETLFFKWWVNEYFISSMLTIYWIVKLITVPLLLSKLKVKIIMYIILGILSTRSIVRFIFSYNNYNNAIKIAIKNLFNPKPSESVPSAPPLPPIASAPLSPDGINIDLLDNVPPSKEHKPPSDELLKLYPEKSDNIEGKNNPMREGNRLLKELQNRKLENNRI
jgi:hypothetical protein